MTTHFAPEYCTPTVRSSSLRPFTFFCLIGFRYLYFSALLSSFPSLLRDVPLTNTFVSHAPVPRFSTHSTTTRSNFFTSPLRTPVPVYSVGCPWSIARKLCRKMSRNSRETLPQGTKKTAAMHPRPVCLLRLDSRVSFSELCTVPAVVCYCIASIMMTVVNKVWGMFVRHP